MFCSGIFFNFSVNFPTTINMSNVALSIVIPALPTHKQTTSYMRALHVPSRMERDPLSDTSTDTTTRKSNKWLYNGLKLIHGKYITAWSTQHLLQ